MAEQHYDAIVIGAGQGGVPLATTLAKAGRKTALVEREHVGGTCINEGCTPTKTMVASAKVAYFDRRSADYGVSNGQVAVDMIRVRQRKREIVDSFRSGGERRLHDAGVELIMGEARFSGPKTSRCDSTMVAKPFALPPTTSSSTPEQGPPTRRSRD
jgi:pyruvate/2-oxoglutarate dehydrogenase complex dihydrolipoamide dehydrogenase (E3) component